jgi:peptidoglycan/xylan/chitin deacetylase (PgdA/CDA1 family)
MKGLGFLRTLFEFVLVAAIVVLLARRTQSSAPLWGSVVHSVACKDKVVALTFDDGPHPTFTPQVLDLLEAHHAKGTFFMIGQRMEKYPGIVRQVVTRGHVIGNHTFSHPGDIEALTEVQITNDLELCEGVIERMTGKRTHLFRPPRGLIDGTVFTIAAERGYQTILWTVCADHRKAPTPEDMAQRVLRRLRPGAIILVHDGRSPARAKDVTATRLIIEELAERGYRFVTVPELLQAAAAGPANTLAPKWWLPAAAWLHRGTDPR